MIYSKILQDKQIYVTKNRKYCEFYIANWSQVCQFNYTTVQMVQKCHQLSPIDWCKYFLMDRISSN